MRVMISAEGNHEPAGHHLIMVDGVATLVDLSGITGSLHDPSIKRVEWDGGSGTITRTDGSSRRFGDRAALMPYIEAFKAKMATHAKA